MMLAVNHVAPFLLTTQLLSLLQASAPARIVTVASGAHKIGRLNLDDFQATRGYGPFGLPRYSETKLMNVMFTRELARRTEGTGVTVNCLHPGAVATNLGSPSDSLQPLARMILLDAARGAETTLAVATKPEYANVNGSYFVKSKPADHKLSKAAKNTEVAAALWSATEALLVTPPSPTNCGSS